MASFALDVKGICALSTINGEVSFDIEGTESEGIVVISNVLASCAAASRQKRDWGTYLESNPLGVNITAEGGRQIGPS